MTGRRDHIRRIIATYPFPLRVDHLTAPKPHKLPKLPYDFAYLPLQREGGTYYLFLTEDDRNHFVATYTMRLQIPSPWPPEKYR